MGYFKYLNEFGYMQELSIYNFKFNNESLELFKNYKQLFKNYKQLFKNYKPDTAGKMWLMLKEKGLI